MSRTVEGYIRAAAYVPDCGMSAAIRKGKPEPEPRADAEIIELPIRTDRKRIEEAAESGSTGEIAEILMRGRFESSGLCDYRTMAETTNIPHELQVALAKRFVELAEEQEKSRESKPNKAGVAIIAVTAIGTFAGMGEGGFVAGIISSAVAACIFWRKNEKKIDENRDHAARIVASGRLTSNDAREAFTDYLGFAKVENRGDFENGA